nr:hypothetical protein [Tanacetum cinerariifolium]
MFDRSSRFICQNLQFIWSQTSHTKSSDEILKPFFGKGFSKQTGLHEMAMAAFESQYIGRKVLYDWVNNASVLVRFLIKSSDEELELARGGGSGVIDDVYDDGEPCCVLETFDNNARGSAVG